MQISLEIFPLSSVLLQHGDSTQSFSKPRRKRAVRVRLMTMTRGAMQSSRLWRMFQIRMAAASVAKRQAPMFRQQDHERLVYGPIRQNVTSPITRTKPARRMAELLLMSSSLEFLQWQNAIGICHRHLNIYRLTVHKSVEPFHPYYDMLDVFLKAYLGLIICAKRVP